MKTKELSESVRLLPDACGVYLFRSGDNTILYIGKAKSLKKRVSSYFSRQLNAKTQALVAKIVSVEYRLTASEAQAQVLEASLIKELQPQYNIDLKDDKSFPWIRMSDEEYPQVGIVRRHHLAPLHKGLQRAPLLGGRFFGPFTNAKALRQALKVIRRLFGFRSCRVMPRRACLYFRLGECPAPCEKRITPAQYRARIERVVLFLEGRYASLVASLAGTMQELSRAHRYEEAAALRDQISALQALQEKPGAQGAELSGLQTLQRELGLQALPMTIEAFDISTLSGAAASGAMVRFRRGMPDKAQYRRYRIKTVRGSDDYAMIREVVRRRYARLLREGAALPDLILIDGGQGHVSAAQEELRRLGIAVPAVGIAKQDELLYLPRRNRPLALPAQSEALRILKRLRDEAHRFARAYHHYLRSERTFAGSRGAG